MNRWIAFLPTLEFSLRRAFWFTLGAVALILGAIGVVLPVLPTTPFVILAAFCFGRSVPALQIWLENTQTFGPLIADWREHGAIAPRIKALAVAMMVSAFGLSLAMGMSAKVLTIQGLCLLAAATYVLTRPNGPL
ncbi:YbaN family protein [Pseudoprimorskyibacter insulae]|uniref:Inner membrane protein YbaN n=1 Tax=Pseudoprimorskyibacter insulae TaxID=1695997 RepID=A0A2R8AU49_9RHOB|nr:YbaN family protein [Pseudoprimorskyibacter insulae]SPF79581.1 Inner membrane protein YbaN [Pseudoprimorskyibacter insulae]